MFNQEKLPISKKNGELVKSADLFVRGDVDVGRKNMAPITVNCAAHTGYWKLFVGKNVDVKR